MHVEGLLLGNGTEELGVADANTRAKAQFVVFVGWKFPFSEPGARACLLRSDPPTVGGDPQFCVKARNRRIGNTKVHWAGAADA